MADDEVPSEPVMLGLLFADSVVEEKTGKKIIIGTFTRFNAPHVPVVFPPWSIYASVANIVGEHSFTLNLTHDATNRVVFSVGGKCESQSYESVLEIIVPIMGAVFVEMGKYHLTFDVDGHQIGARVLEVVPQGG